MYYVRPQETKAGRTIGSMTGLPGPHSVSLRKVDEPVEHEVTVRAVYNGSTYTLQVEANGQHTEVSNVDQADLEAEIGRIIRAVSKAQRNGTLSKSQSERFSLGMNTPRSGRDALRF